MIINYISYILNTNLHIFRFMDNLKTIDYNLYMKIQHFQHLDTIKKI